MSTFTYTHQTPKHLPIVKLVFVSFNRNNAKRSKYHQLFDWIDLCRRRQWNAKAKEKHRTVFLFIAAYVPLLLSLTQFYRMSMGSRFSFFLSYFYALFVPACAALCCAALRFYCARCTACVRYFCFNTLVSVCKCVCVFLFIRFINFCDLIHSFRP